MKYFILVSLIIIGSCKVSSDDKTLNSTIKGVQDTEQEYSLYRVGNRIHGWNLKTDQSDYYLDKIQPIFSKRCVACHGCYEAACQLNLQSYKRLRRGFNPTPIFSEKRLKTTISTRPNFTDQMQFKQLRTSRGFLPVIGHPDEYYGEDKNPENSLLQIFIEEGQKNKVGFSPTKLLPLQDRWDSVELHQCVATPQQYSRHFAKRNKNPWGVMTPQQYFSKYPTGGMPFGLAPLDKSSELAVLTQWLDQGKSTGPTKTAMDLITTPVNSKHLDSWEKFLNADGAKAEQSARYIYEHTYTAHIAFDELPGDFYDLVRSRSKTGAINEIITVHPYDSPGQTRAFYRFRKIDRSIVQKKHIIWRLNEAKRGYLQDLFWNTPWSDEQQRPIYGSNNPFQIFKNIPANIRSRFMLENSNIIAGAMVQGSVCVGSKATYAIRDHFWVWFLSPDIDPSVQRPSLGLSSLSDLKMGSVIAHRKYGAAYEDSLRAVLRSKGRKGLAISDIWNGKKFTTPATGDPYYQIANPNAWLNITRHRRNSTVQYGPEGGTPQSIWILSYSNFERLYYNLVANYVENENWKHKMKTWEHMSHIRLEAEDLAISLMPHQIRKRVRKHFTKGIGLVVQKALFPMHSWRSLLSQPRIAETKGISGQSTQGAIDSLTSLGWKHLEDSARGHDATEWKFGDYTSDWHKALSEISTLTKKRKLRLAQSMPETTYIRVKRSGKEDLAFSILADRSYISHNLMQFENLTRDPHNDAISVYRGFVGAFPNVFLDFSEDDLNNFIADLKKMPSNSARYPWLKTFESYAVKRTSAEFWPYYDWVHRWKATKRPGNDPVAQGIVDLGHYAFF